jgi:hypothetical protein
LKRDRPAIFWFIGPGFWEAERKSFIDWSEVGLKGVEVMERVKEIVFDEIPILF